MRVNIYNEELTNEVEIVSTSPRPGVSYVGIRVFQKSAPELHNRPDDDDRSAITFWVGDLRQAAVFAAAIWGAIKRGLAESQANAPAEAEFPHEG